MSTKAIAAALTAAGANAWTHPSTGETRYYLNSALDLIDGLTFTRYIHGQIGKATFNGETMSNTWLNKVAATVKRGVFATISTDGTITVTAPDAAQWVKGAIAATLTAMTTPEERP